MRQVAARVLIVVGCLLLIPVTAVLTAAAKQRFADGSNRVFSGGPLVSGELHAGAEPDWSFTDDVQTIDLQLLDPPRSRRIWIQAHDDKIYVFSGFMSTAVGRLWKRWPVQAESDGRAVLRIDGKRYERQLVRIDRVRRSKASPGPFETSTRTMSAGPRWKRGIPGCSRPRRGRHGSTA